MIVELVDKLLDRALQLNDYKNQRHQALLDRHLSPMFEEFDQVHRAYLDSFSRYRTCIEQNTESNWIDELRALVEKENLFSASSRSKILRLSGGEQDKRLVSITQGIAEYLLGARLVDPLGKQEFPHLVQRWRQSFCRTLEKIAQGNWQMVIDPDGSMPPLSPNKIHEELAKRRAKYPVKTEPGKEQDALRRSCALYALDALVGEMQGRYDDICKMWGELLGSKS